MSDIESRFQEDQLLIERFAALFGFERLSTAVPGPDIYPPYLFVGFFLFLDHGVIQTFIHVTGGTHALVNNPIILAGVGAAFLGVFGIRYMSNKYARAIVDSNIHDRVDEELVPAFAQPVSWRLKVTVYIVAVVLLYANILFSIGFSTLLQQRTGALPVHLINWFFVFQFVYLPIVVEFGLIYYSIHFTLPQRVKKADISLFFYDPRNMGGFAAIGQLLKRSYYLYTAGLLGLFLLVYGGVFLSPGSENIPGVFEFVFFSAAWVVGLASIGHSMYTMHQIMTRKKRQRIRELETEMRDAIEHPYDINASTVSDQDRLDDISRRLEQVRDTRVYPATFTMWSQIAISVLLPQVLQLVVQTL